MVETFRTSTVGARLFAAGRSALLSVGLGGLTLGFFFWYQIIVHAGRYVAANDLLFVLALFAGVGCSVSVWYRYSLALARRSPLPLRSILQQDAWSWLSLMFFWLGFTAPPAHIFGGHTAFISIWTTLADRSVALGIGTFALAKLVTAISANYTVRDVATTFFVTRVPLIVIAELAASMIGQRAGMHASVSTNPLLAVWGRWDAVHYVDIATRGYFDTDMAFFPLYPALIAVFGRMVGNHVLAGLLISNIAFFFGLLFLYRLIEATHDRRVAHRAIFYISIFPTAIFFSAVYTESLFFALTVGAFYYIRERRWLAAGAFGFLAALTRVEGVLLVAPMLYEVCMYERRPQEFVRGLIATGLCGAGLICFMAYLWAVQGDPLFFSHVQSHWDRHLAPPWTSIWHSIHTITTSTNGTAIANQSLELAFTIFMVAILVASIRVMRPSYAIYTALSIIVPMSTSSLMSMPRFALVLFPLFIILALWGRKPAVHNAIVSFSLPLLGLFTALFADWYWVA